jgi:hypothetical protein
MHKKKIKYRDIKRAMDEFSLETNDFEINLFALYLRKQGYNVLYMGDFTLKPKVKEVATIENLHKHFFG